MEAELKIVLLVAQIYQEVLLLLAQILMKASKTFRYRNQIVDIISAANPNVAFKKLLQVNNLEKVIFAHHFLLLKNSTDYST